ncbi:MAG TPA: hypothetical protein VFC12_06155 [Terriglobales bacterium]|nr:hypothetical protein [Terriglobales bacterium]
MTIRSSFAGLAQPWRPVAGCAVAGVVPLLHDHPGCGGMADRDRLILAGR